jgi:glycosyltransferase involved in cell wall biosynthesis
MPDLVGSGLKLLGVEEERRYRVEDWFLGLDAQRRGLAGANVVLNTCGNGGLRFLRWAKSRGLKIATDVVITPRVYEIMAEEHERWPDWEPAYDIRKAAGIYRKYTEAVVAVSDILLCPSDTVEDGLASVRGFDITKVVKVPYGLGTTRVLPGSPIPKRILFSGHADLRKGLPYLAKAAQILRAEDSGFEIRVAGNASDIVRRQPDCAALTFLGHLSPKKMEEEFYFADVFCLPSLAEGMASVTLEALASGVPCVVTRAAGAPVTDGQEGLIVPERDYVSLAAALRTISNNRDLRARMSFAAAHRAREHTLDQVGDHLQAALIDLLGRKQVVHT